MFNSPMKQIRTFLFLFIFSLSVLLEGCGSLTPAPIAEGSDPVVVNAERAQRSSLDIFRIVTTWEFNNRLALPPEVSRVVDRYRTEFPPIWNESRLALKKYKEVAGTNNPTAINSITAALLASQDSLLKLKKNASPNEVVQVGNALSSLISSVRSFFPSTPAPALKPQP
jgi:hypothetical protein